MSEKDNEKHVFSYMDGIPVKISEKYKPPRRVILPVGFQNRLLQPPVSAEYDFDLEEQILDKLQQWRDVRFKDREKRKERITAEDDELKLVEKKMQELRESVPESTEDDINSANGSTPTPPSPASTAPGPLPQSLPECAPTNRETNPILRPIPIKHHVVASQINNNKPISAFNLSDFEADTSSPFDNMELKTINDLEELAQVLQPSVNLQPSGYFQSTMPSGQMYATVQHIVNQNQSFNSPPNVKMLNDPKGSMNYQPHVNGLTSSYGVFNSLSASAHQMMDSYQLNTPANSYHPQSIVPSSSCEQSVPYNFMEREQVARSTPAHFDYNTQEPKRKEQSLYHNNVWPSSGTFRPTGNDSSSHQYQLNTPGDLPSNNPVYMFSSQSSPDQSGDTTPPSESAVGEVAQQLSELLKLKSSRSATQSVSVSKEVHSISDEAPNAILQDSFMSLHPNDQLLAQKITEMGFPRARVARACKALGGNDKKVVESLLSLQSLLDAGYPEERAEHALTLNDYDVSAASRFLQVESQLLGLGFPVEQVSEALLKFSCDRDKALDFLIS